MRGRKEEVSYVCACVFRVWIYVELRAGVGDVDHLLGQVAVGFMHAAAEGGAELEHGPASGQCGEVDGRVEAVVHVQEGDRAAGVRKGDDGSVAVLRGVVDEGGSIAVARAKGRGANVSEEADDIEVPVDSGKMAGGGAEGAFGQHKAGVFVGNEFDDGHVAAFGCCMGCCFLDVIDHC